MRGRGHLPVPALTTTDRPSGGNLADRFEGIVDLHPDLPAVETIGSTADYTALDARANRVAHWLTDLGVSPGDRIGVALWNRPEHLEVLLGAFKARIVPVNVNHRYTATETRAVLRDADARVIVHEPTATLTVSEACGDDDRVRVAVGPAYEAALAASSPDRPRVTRSDDDRYVLYTGGTTGTPKGVVWRQGDLITAVMPGAATRRPGSRLLPAGPLTHGTAQWTSLSTLLSGGTVVFDRPTGLDPVGLWTRVATAHVSRLVIVGDTFAHPLLDALDAEPDRWDLSALVAITSGGARWSAATQRGLLAHLPHVAMVNSFGASETGGQGSEVRFAGIEPAQASGLLRFEAGDDTTVVLDDDGRPLPPGSERIGRLARRGPVPLGYLGDPERSADTFPVIDGVRHTMPGDMARVADDGTIVVLGRTRNVINTGGEKVFAEEVETRLIEHPDIAQAVVVGVPHERWGETIAALVAPVAGRAVSTDDLVTHCARTLARFKIPRRIEVVDTIRHLPTGKLDRRWAADTMASLTTATTGT